VIIQVCATQITNVLPAGTDVAARWGKRLWGDMACFVGVHHWSDWQVPDPENPSEQVRTCSRCSRTETNAPPVPIKAWKMPLRLSDLASHTVDPDPGAS
jgi:hypothetical protein